MSRARRFCLDANILIQAKNGPYGFELAPGFWDLLDQKLRTGEVYSSSEVLGEIRRHPDSLATWADARAEFFLSPDEETQATYRQIVAFVHERFEARYVGRFLEGADPWVISRAKRDSSCLVTLEKYQARARKIKIPNVCQSFGVECKNTQEMLEALGARFVLA